MARLGALLLASLLLPALCSAAPRDPLWVPGVYDGGDLDDRQTVTESSLPTIRHGTAWLPGRESAALTAIQAAPVHRLGARSIRAPPIP
jgi:hypothetical protein